MNRTAKNATRVFISLTFWFAGGTASATPDSLGDFSSIGLIPGTNYQAAEFRNTDPCLDPQVIRITRPLYPFHPTSEIFNFAFKDMPSSHASSTTIIVLPGGPGQTSIRSSDFLPSEISETYNVIYTDPRGVGCNKLASIPKPEDFFTTENIASDVLAIIQNKNLKNYVLYGQSYGTQLATVVAGLAPSMGIQSPSKLVLEGVLGRAYVDKESTEPPLRIWKKVFGQMAQSSREKIEQEQLPFHQSGEQWGDWIKGALAMGATPDPTLKGKNAVAIIFDLILDPAVTGEALEYIRKLYGIGEPGAQIPQEILELHRFISCRETSNYQAEYTLRKENLLAEDPKPNHCQGLTLSRPFDSKKWSLKMPIYYFSGEDDPATPPWQTDYHSRGQQYAERFSVEVVGGGHGSLALSLADCTAPLWKAILKDDGTFVSELGRCKMKTKYQHFTAKTE